MSHIGSVHQFCAHNTTMATSASSANSTRQCNTPSSTGGASPTNPQEVAPPSSTGVQQDLIARLLNVPDAVALGFDDEIFSFVWRETFPSDSYPQDRSDILTKLRLIYPAGTLEKD